MIIDGTLASNKTEILIDRYVNLLNNGVDASKILVLAANSNLKNFFVKKTLEKLSINCFEKLQVHSYFSLVYNTINDNWAFIENKNPLPNPTICPNMAGLEVSQFILKDILKTVPFKGYNSKKSLLHQIFRRYSLIVQNNLSEEEIDYRSKVLGESFAEDVKLVLKKLLKQTLYLRDFDYLRQGLVFEHIFKTSDYFKNIEYLIVDDGDEVTPACYNFIEHLKPQLKDYYIAFDSKGSSRIGYLSADKTAVWEFEKLFDQPRTTLDINTKLKFDAETIYRNITENKVDELENFSVQSPSKRSKMLELVADEINKLLKNKVLPSEISIITPIIDDMLKFTLTNLIKKPANLLFLTGSEKLIQNKFVLASLTILKLNSGLKDKLTEFDIRSILINCLEIPLKYCRTILANFDLTHELMPYEFENQEYSEKYAKLLDLVNNKLPQMDKLSEQVYEIYSNLISISEKNASQITKFNFFIKQLLDFENVFGEKFIQRKEEIITQTENSIIAENPYSTLEINENDLVISTPQKLIDNQLRTKYQFWLDTTSNEWIKSDTGPLYNAWVFQKGWNKDSFTVEDNIELGKEKTARILRKLTLCANEKIYTFNSLFDSNGIENFGGINEYLIIKQDKTEQELAKPQVFKIVPREDQKPVLEYQKGAMAISAVPGAGKTTILLALIVRLLDRGINPDNIFVMTYMESAARNFRDRIKAIRENSSKLPYISTIHGLALRIIKENSNFERLGLSSDFEICDDTQKSRIIREITKKLTLEKKDLIEFTQAISVFKIGRGDLKNISPNNKKLQLFKRFFELYQANLNANNLIDYDDILVLSVKLLEDNADIREYYQNICQYIIEDEAQDSSSVQQRLINILTGRYKNIIRCGDINQAITTTFTNADVKGFRTFITSSQNVSMNCSQRCTRDVWQLANTVLTNAETTPDTKDSFYHILMNPVEGKNPVEENAIHSHIFDKPQEEQNFILREIKNELRKKPKLTIGILVRNNNQVVEWTNFINNSGLKCITRSECLEQKSIFRAIFAILKIVLNPFDNNIIAQSYETLSAIGLYKPLDIKEIQNYETPFIEISPDDITENSLQQFQWDILYWTAFPNLTVDELAIKIGLYYFSSEIEKSNIYLIATLIKRISSDTKNISTIIERLGELAKRNSLSGFKFFSEEDENNKGFFEGKVQVMTYHKSKGDEFDYVFMPEMTEKNLPIDFCKYKYKQSDFTEQVKALNSQYKVKSEYELKQEIVAENLRLLYVAITRAKRRLYLTTSNKVKYFGRLKPEVPSKIFQLIDEKSNIINSTRQV